MRTWTKQAKRYRWWFKENSGKWWLRRKVWFTSKIINPVFKMWCCFPITAIQSLLQKQPQLFANVTSFGTNLAWSTLVFRSSQTSWICPGQQYVYIFLSIYLFWNRIQRVQSTWRQYVKVCTKVLVVQIVPSVLFHSNPNHLHFQINAMAMFATGLPPSQHSPNRW